MLLQRKTRTFWLDKTLHEPLKVMSGTYGTA